MHMTPKLRAAALTLAALTAAASAAPSPGDAVVIKAGTIHLVEVGETIRGGAVLVEDGKIVAIGPADTIDVPGGASIVDHGPDAVIVPASDGGFDERAGRDRSPDACRCRFVRRAPHLDRDQARSAFAVCCDLLREVGGQRRE